MVWKLRKADDVHCPDKPVKVVLYDGSGRRDQPNSALVAGGTIKVTAIP
jgi:hypothetical protein